MVLSRLADLGVTVEFLTLCLALRFGLVSDSDPHGLGLGSIVVAIESSRGIDVKKLSTGRSIVLFDIF